MNVLGIGNAIVDVVCKINDEFLIENELTKSTMKLVDENEFKKLLGNLKIEKTISGGSVANSIVGLSQLGNKVGFIGKVNKDDLGQKYVEGLIKEKVKFHCKVKTETIPTGTCLILITPDSERTMCTFLGTAGKISEKDIDEKVIEQSEITFLGLLNTKKFNDVIDFAKKTKKLIVITRGKDGAIAIQNNNIEECEAEKNLNIKDLTGAGDLFASGFLHGFVNNLSLRESLKKGTELSSKIIQQVGARI